MLAGSSARRFKWCSKEQHNLPARRTVAIIGAILIFSGAAFASFARNADAAACGSKCYGTANWDNQAWYGSIAWLRVGPFGVGSNCNEFAVGTLWLITGNGWIENGYHYGKRYRLQGCYGLWWYWAETRPGLDLTDYYNANWGVAYNTDTPAKINWIGNGTYPSIKTAE